MEPSSQPEGTVTPLRSRRSLRPHPPRKPSSNIPSSLGKLTRLCPEAGAIANAETAQRGTAVEPSGLFIVTEGDGQSTWTITTTLRPTSRAQPLLRAAIIQGPGHEASCPGGPSRNDTTSSLNTTLEEWGHPTTVCPHTHTHFRPEGHSPLSRNITHSNTLQFDFWCRIVDSFYTNGLERIL